MKKKRQLSVWTSSRTDIMTKRIVVQIARDRRISTSAWVREVVHEAMLRVLRERKSSR
jgi:hypothetical protein